MIEFLRMSAGHEDIDLKLEIPVSIDEANTFVHGMRVELSRMKTLMRNRGRVIRPFKLLHIKTLATSTRDKCIVVLQRSHSRLTTIHNVVEEAFGKDLGDQIDVD